MPKMPKRSPPKIVFPKPPLGEERGSKSEIEMERQDVKGKGKEGGKKREKLKGSEKPRTRKASPHLEASLLDLSETPSLQESAGGEQALKKKPSKMPKGEALIGRRSKLETCMDIIRAVADGYRKPTHIMYRANLSWVRMQRYLRLLVDQGYVRKSKSSEGILYHPTEKGIKLLAYFQKAQADLQALLVGNPAERRARGVLSLAMDEGAMEEEEGRSEKGQR
ncbi:MAG: winged helix-turn-helix domain-containing protein [Candidatus Bathyarchaeia archaeon]